MVGLANETGVPSNNAYGLGGASATLTFESANTTLPWGFTVSAPGSMSPSDVTTGFTFNDTEGTSIFQTGALSPGDINNHENDDVTFRITSGPALHGFGFDLLNSIQDGAIPETVQILGAGDVLLGTLAISQSTLGGTDRNIFIGVTSDTPITGIAFDEDSNGDDIAIRNFRFAETKVTAVPEPSSFAFAGIASFAWALVRRKRNVLS